MINNAGILDDSRWELQIAINVVSKLVTFMRLLCAVIDGVFPGLRSGLVLQTLGRKFILNRDFSALVNNVQG